jgi:hypothetical protein
VWGRTSVTAGTIFDRTRAPLTVWFTACWLFAAQKDGVSALSLRRSLEIGSYQTAWAMLHRLRSVLVRPGRDRLSGTVEVHETYVGGEEPGLRGGRAKGKKSLVGVAVERREPRGFGRCRMAVLADASTESLRAFLTDHVEEARASSPTAGSPTEGPPWPLHPRASRRPRLPGVPTAARGSPGGLVGQAVAPRHPPGLGGRGPPCRLPERVRVPLQPSPLPQRGHLFYRMLELAVAHEPVRYRDLIVNREPKTSPRIAPAGRGHPPSLERPPANRPWRTA